MVRYGVLLANLVVLLGVVGFVIQSSRAKPIISQNAAVSASSDTATAPLDQLSSADIAINVARMTNLSEALAVANNADSLSSLLALSSSNDIVVGKPQIVSTALKSIKDLQEYTVKAGESLGDLASRFYVTSDSIRWSNNLPSNTIHEGQKLWIIPTVSGIIYDVKAGDTAESLATKYHTGKDKIITFNDAEISGLMPGKKIMIPDGTIQAAPSYSYSYAGYAFGSAAIYGFNGYDPGNCTWYAAGVRAKSGNPVPANLGNAESWLVGAQSAGLGVGRTPKAGAVIWYNPKSGPFHRSDTPGQVYRVGHVGIVDSVDGDGAAHISDMNVRGLYSMHYETISAADAGNYWYIY